jgi:hypothetical protein
MEIVIWIIKIFSLFIFTYLGTMYAMDTTEERSGG